MSKDRQTSKKQSQSRDRNQLSFELDIQNEHPFDTPIQNLSGLAVDGTIDGQRERVRSASMQSVQRRKLVTSIGKAQGNRHLGYVIGSKNPSANGRKAIQRALPLPAAQLGLLRSKIGGSPFVVQGS